MTDMTEAAEIAKKASPELCFAVLKADRPRLAWELSKSHQGGPAATLVRKSGLFDSRYGRDGLRNYWLNETGQAVRKILLEGDAV